MSEEFTNADVFVGEGYIGQDSKSFDEEHWQEVYAAYQNKLIIKGEVKAIEVHELKSGGEKRETSCMIVYFGDNIKGMIPAAESGIKDKKNEDYETGAKRLKAVMSHMIGRSVVFKVKAVDKPNNLVLLSRKDALEHMQGVTWAKISEGDEVNAIVRRVTPYIAYLNIGGIDVTLPAKEMSHGWIWDAREHLKVGDNIKVKIIKVDKDNKKLMVSMKAIIPDKWNQIITKYSVNGEYLGKISGIKEYGVFINLENGVDALILLPKSGKVLEKMKLGLKVSIRIKDINTEKRRIQGRLVRIVE